MLDAIRVEGPDQAVYLFDTRLVGVNVDNGKKLLVTLALIVLLLLVGWLLRVLTRVMLRGNKKERTAFWTCQGIPFVRRGVHAFWNCIHLV